jgi:hypothetical protein
MLTLAGLKELGRLSRPETVHAKGLPLLRKIGSESRDPLAALTLINHFGYRAAAAAHYSLAEARFPGDYLRGLAFGAVEWVVRYFGLLPAVRISAPATRHLLSRCALMLVAHLLGDSPWRSLSKRSVGKKPPSRVA